MKRSIKLYQPAELSPCGYLSEKLSSSQYTDPYIELDKHLLTRLNQVGFRRSGQLLHRPACPDCSACISIRIPLASFKFKKSYRRTLKKLNHWELSVEKPTMDLYPIYERYVSERHSDGSMFPPSPKQFEDFLITGYEESRFLVAREEGKPVACLVFDPLEDGLSSVYCFFDPDKSADSPGSFMILQICKLALALGLPFHYLGYWVANSPKMEYKTRFQPLQYFINGQWKDSFPAVEL